MKWNTVENVIDALGPACKLHGYPIRPPADAAAIRELELELKTEFGLVLVDSFRDMLRLANGFEWNGVVFYGASSRDDGDHAWLGHLVEYTRMRWKDYGKLAVGYSEDQVYLWNAEAVNYEVFRHSDKEPYRKFGRLVDLLNYALDGRWP